AMASRPLSRSLDRCGATSVITWSSRLSAALPDSRSACSRNSDLCSSSRCCSKRASCSFWRVASLQYPYANANDTTNANAAITASNELGFFASADIPAHEARAVPANETRALHQPGGMQRQRVVIVGGGFGDFARLAR